MVCLMHVVMIIRLTVNFQPGSCTLIENSVYSLDF